MNKLLIATTVPATLRAFLLPYADHFRARGWRVDAASNGVQAAADVVPHFDETHDVPWERSPTALANVRAAKEVRRLVEKQRYDIVHVHTPVAAFVVRYALRNMQPRPVVIYTAHGFHFHAGARRAEATAYRTLEKLAGPWTDYLVTINREDEQAARAHLIVPDSRIRYHAGIGVDTTALQRNMVVPESVNELQRELGIAGTPYFLMIAEFNPGKRHRDAVHAFAKMERKDAHLLLAGTGPLQGATRELAQRLGVADRVHLLGFRRDIPRLIVGAAALLLPSEREGLPRSVLEAMSLGAAVIGANSRGTRDLLEGGGGFLHDVGDAAALARHMDHVLAHPSEAAALGAGASQRAAAYDIQKIIALHDDLYNEALQARENKA